MLTDDTFLALTVRAERLEREALEMELYFNELGVFFEDTTKPEGSIRRCAKRFETIAGSLNELVDKAEKSRGTYMEAAE